MPDGPSRGFWAELGARERELLSSAGREYRVPRGRRLFDEGQPAPSVAVLLEGRLKVSTTTLDGRERLLAVRSPGDLLGEMASLTGRTRNATVTAVDPVRALMVPAADFESLWRAEPGILGAMVRMLVARVEEADQSRMDLLDDASVRVERTLVDLAHRLGVIEADGARRIEAALTQEELANLAFTSRGVVTAVLRDLRRDGLVRTGRRTLVVVDAAAIEQRLGARRS